MGAREALVAYPNPCRQSRLRVTNRRDQGYIPRPSTCTNPAIPRVAQDYASQGLTNMRPVLESDGFVGYIRLVNEPAHATAHLQHKAI